MCVKVKGTPDGWCGAGEGRAQVDRRLWAEPWVRSQDPEGAAAEETTALWMW